MSIRTNHDSGERYVTLTVTHRAYPVGGGWWTVTQKKEHHDEKLVEAWVSKERVRELAKELRR